nr:hypothetical protein [uncultured bacterium]
MSPTLDHNQKYMSITCMFMPTCNSWDHFKIYLRSNIGLGFNIILSSFIDDLCL